MTLLLFSVLFFVCSSSTWSHLEQEVYSYGLLSDVLPTVHLNRNISDLITGTWHSPQAIPAFISTEGNFSLRVVNTNSGVDEVDVVQSLVVHFFQVSDTVNEMVPLLVLHAPAYTIKGSVVIVDGTFGDDISLRLSVQGFYQWEMGNLVLLGSHEGLDSPVIQDYFADLSNTSNILDFDVDTETFRYTGRNNITQESDIAEVQSTCYFKIRLLFQEVDQSIREIDNGGASDKKNMLSSLDWTIKKPYQHLTGILESPNCNFSTEIEASTFLVERFFRKISNYNFFIIALTLLQIYSYINLFGHVTTTSDRAKVSTYFILIQALMDAYTALGHLLYGVNSETLFNLFCLTSFLQFILFSVFEMQMLYGVLHVNHPEIFRNGRRFQLLFLLFYGILCIMLTLQYWTLVLRIHVYPVIITMAYSYPAFQIFHSAYHSASRPLTPRYIVYMGITRLDLFLCPDNFLFNKPSPVFCGVLIFWFGLQTIVLLLQELKGPQFFVLSFMVPEKYNYFRPIPLPEGAECVICRCEIEEERVMVTPCNHIFHEQCLTRWFETKLQCPTCRAQVPLPDGFAK